MTCSIMSPASKVESIPPTLAGLVEVSLVVQQLNHTLQMRKQLACDRKQLACERKQLACESTALLGHRTMATMTLSAVISHYRKIPASQEVFQVGWAHRNGARASLDNCNSEVPSAPNFAFCTI